MNMFKFFLFLFLLYSKHSVSFPLYWLFDSIWSYFASLQGNVSKNEDRTSQLPSLPTSNESQGIFSCCCNGCSVHSHTVVHHLSASVQ